VKFLFDFPAAVMYNRNEIKKLCKSAYVIKQGKVAKASEI
jgi:hypothetical protein